MPDLVEQQPLDVWSAIVAGCPTCEKTSTTFAAIDIAIDGDQIAIDCHQCGRIVRPFSWHEGAGLPSSYLGRVDHHGAAIEVAAWYWPSGTIRLVPAVDPDRPFLHFWPHAFDSLSLTRALLGHLVGLDVPAVTWEEFATEIVAPFVSGPGRGGEWTLPVDDVVEWLAVNR